MKRQGPACKIVAGRNLLFHLQMPVLTGGGGEGYPIPFQILIWESACLLELVNEEVSNWPPGSYQRLDLFIQVLRVLCPNLTDASKPVKG